ncbi:hypothetical protein [Parasitella parasitica]|uniref:Rhamnogalacturonan lyase domain-containing protein n=1 Tax=Parasitella parasitica TaxID=35722 RepID=A0A0B7NE02_9FUNG|nr:hypothetical protein [Parasitella parasitica]
MLKSILLCVIAAIIMVFADSINIESPTSDKYFGPGSVIGFKYRVQKGGNGLMKQASAELVNAETNERVPSFPSMKWSMEKSDVISRKWKVPNKVKAGAYKLVITGEGIYNDVSQSGPKAKEMTFAPAEVIFHINSVRKTN